MKTFWNVASDKGLRVGVVNWWATWPADAVNGWVVTDRAAFKLEKGGAPDREVHPAGGLRAPAAAARPRGARARAPPRPLPPRRRPGAPRHGAAGPRGALPARARHLHHAAARRGAGERPRGARREARRRCASSTASSTASSARRWRSSDAGDVLVLVGDPGRLAREGSPPAEGLLVLAGGPVAPGDLGAVSERDVAPTVLHLLGLPRSRELDGQVLEAALSRGVPPRPPGAPRRLVRPPPAVPRRPERLRPGRPRAAQEPRLHPVGVRS